MTHCKLLDLVVTNVECYININAITQWVSVLSITQSALSVSIIVIGKGIGDQSSNLDEAVCISLPASAFGKNMDLSTLLYLFTLA